MHEVKRRPPRRRDGATEGPRGTHPFDPVLLIILYVFSRLFPVNCEGRTVGLVCLCAPECPGLPPVSFYSFTRYWYTTFSERERGL